MELLGAEITSVLQALLMAASLLSAGLLVALVTIDQRSARKPAPVVILEPAPTPEPPPVVTGRAQARPSVHLLTRAPPVSPRCLQFGHADRPSVE